MFWSLPIGPCPTPQLIEYSKDRAPITGHVLVKTVSENTRYLADRETGFRAIRPREARRDTAATGARLTGTLRSVERAALPPKRFASKDSARLASADGYKLQTERRLTV